VRLTDLVPTLPEECNAFVEKTMAQSPDDRFQTASEFREALMALYQLAVDKGLAAPLEPAEPAEPAEPQPAVPPPAEEAPSPASPELPPLPSIEDAAASSGETEAEPDEAAIETPVHPPSEGREDSRGLLGKLKRVVLKVFGRS